MRWFQVAIARSIGEQKLIDKQWRAKQYAEIFHVSTELVLERRLV